VIAQHSEASVGPYELADFYLYQFVRLGKTPSQILHLARIANQRGQFDQPYTLDDLHKWLRNFITRFFANQFKRTCMPEGPKIGTVSLSPRGDWRMPSDAIPALWLDDLDAAYAGLRTNAEEAELAVD
jgi:NAD+ synthase (glutamine-hydrolysing)